MQFAYSLPISLSSCFHAITLNTAVSGKLPFKREVVKKKPVGIAISLPWLCEPEMVDLLPPVNSTHLPLEGLHCNKFEGRVSPCLSESHVSVIQKIIPPEA